MALSAPLSVVPGRIRFEDPSLLGQVQACRHLQKRIMEMEGVIDASANHRTGRTLVRFDEAKIGRHVLMERIEEILNLDTLTMVNPGCSICYGPNCGSYITCSSKILKYNPGIKNHKSHSSDDKTQDEFDRLMKVNTINGKVHLHIVRHLLIDLISHAFIPKLFHILLPIVIYTLEKKFNFHVS